MGRVPRINSYIERVQATAQTAIRWDEQALRILDFNDAFNSMLKILPAINVFLWSEEFPSGTYYHSYCTVIFLLIFGFKTSLSVTFFFGFLNFSVYIG